MLEERIRNKKIKNKSNGLFILILCLIFLFGGTILLLEIAKYPKTEETKINKEDVSRKLKDNKASITIEYSTRMQKLLSRENDNGSSKENQFYLQEFKLI